MENKGHKAFVEDVAKLREEIETLRKENIRLISVVEAQFKEHNSEFTSLLNMIKDIKEEVDVDRVVRGRNNHRVENVHSSVTCQAFPCMDNTCIKHYTEEEGNIRKSVSQAARDREGALGSNGRMLERIGNKSKKGKPVTPGMSKSKFWAPVGNNDPGRGQNCSQSLVFMILCLL